MQTIEEKFNNFVKRAIEKHGDKYIYIQDTFTKMSNKTTIICKEHGEFEQNAVNHIRGSGCKKCAVFNNPNTVFLSHDKWVEKFNIAHDYSSRILMMSLSVHIQRLK